MSHQIKCDVKGCNVTAPSPIPYTPLRHGELPDGWRSLRQEAKRPEPPTGQPPGPRRQRVHLPIGFKRYATAHVCPAHPLPEVEAQEEDCEAGVMLGEWEQVPADPGSPA